MNVAQGRLWVVATPIGNLDDLSPRAAEVLRTVGLIAAEDTRHSALLLARVGSRAPCIALHEHNERDQVAHLLERLQQGTDIALISDAGTPLVSDPGYRRPRGREGLGQNVQQHRGILADRVQHDRIAEFGGDFTEDVDALGLEAVEMGQG